MRRTRKVRLLDSVGTAILALGLAVIVWVNAIYQDDPPHDDYYANPVPIEVINQTTGLAITNDPAGTVNVLIRGFQSSWDGLVDSSFHATVDLAGLHEGLHTVPVNVECSDPTVTIMRTQPETTYIALERIDSAAFPITLALENLDELPLGYAVGTPVIEADLARVEGPASIVSTVDSVVASINVAARRDSVNTTVSLKALDATGKTVSGVTLTPSTVRVNLDITRQLNYREVAVQASTTGQPARGYYVSSLAVDPATITVEGPPEVIGEMPGLVAIREPIDIAGATRVIVQRVDLALPEGVSIYTEGLFSEQQVLVTVEVDAIIGGTTVEVPLNPKKLREGYEATLSVPSVDVILTGPAIVLDELALDLVDAYVDLSGMGVGTHQVKTFVDLLTAQNPDLADLAVTSISPAFVEANIRDTSVPTLPAPSAQPTPATTQEP